MDFPNFSELSEEPILFHFEEIEYKLHEPEKLIKWIQSTIETEEKKLHSLSFIFCKDKYLHHINVTYLDHDTLTDVITFPYSENDSTIEGDIYISLERIIENAKKFNVSTLHELKRVMIHGVLHLCGYSDKTEEEAKEMRSKENFYLAAYST